MNVLDPEELELDVGVEILVFVALPRSPVRHGVDLQRNKRRQNDENVEMCCTSLF